MPSLAIDASSAAARILIVDDEQHMCDVCARTLQRGGYSVVATSDPHAAVGLLRDDLPFDLLLTDIKMPTMSGLELARVARDRDPAIAIIIMTGFASIENMHQSVQRGAADFLSKPFELDQLRLAVDQALHKRTILQDNLRLRALEQLIANSEALTTTLDLAALQQIVLHVTLKHSGARASFLLLADDDGLPQQAVVASDGAALLEHGYLLARRAFDDQQPVTDAAAPNSLLHNQPLTYALAVPLRAQGRSNGTLVLCDDRPGLLRPGMQEAIVLLANHAGAALRNAVLYSRLGEAYQRRQELDTLKSEIISIASHELRTPLSLVLGYTMMVRDQASGEQREYLQRVMDGAQRIKEIVDDMVSLRHIETGEAKLTLQPVNLDELIHHALESYQPAVRARSHHVYLELPQPSVVFLSDREKLNVILTNLVSNAIKFTPDGGQIVVRAAVQPLRSPNSDATLITHPPALAANTWVTISVEDSGIGIPQHEHTRIFERFYQVADSLTRERGGTGLGLALVRELAATLGGAVWLVSREGEGSVFAVALPYQPPASLHSD